jgi:hypothetical protein
MQIYERGTGETGRGEVNTLTKTLSATFDGRNFEGTYAVIPDSAGIGIINSKCSVRHAHEFHVRTAHPT